MSSGKVGLVNSGVRFQYFVLRFSFGSVRRKTAVFGSVSPNRTAVSVLFRFCHLFFSS